MTIRQMELFRDYDCYESITGTWITSCVHCRKTQVVKDPDEQAMAWRKHLKECTP